MLEKHFKLKFDIRFWFPKFWICSHWQHWFISILIVPFVVIWFWTSLFERRVSDSLFSHSFKMCSSFSILCFPCSLFRIHFALKIMHHLLLHGLLLLIIKLLFFWIAKICVFFWFELLLAKSDTIWHSSSFVIIFPICHFFSSPYRADSSLCEINMQLIDEAAWTQAVGI